MGRRGPVVETNYGPVRGVADGDLEVFKGIPYAAPPVGELRWRPPASPDSWTAVRDATEFGPACAQTPDEMELDPGTPISEDCLTLNVWTPAVGGAARPVMVFVHGGGFSWGSTHTDWYDGAQFARRGDVVAVTIQYRLGAFGWLHLEGPGGAKYAGSGNNALLDQIAALEWVRDNIAEFGGNPDNVTLVGESAGAISIGSLLAIPEADGLFDRAILQSGSPGLVATEEWADDITARFMSFADATTVEDLSEMSTDELLDAADKLYNSGVSETAFHPVVDGELLTAPPMQILRERGTKVPILLGTNLDEARYWIYYIRFADRVPLEYGRPWLQSITDGNAAEVESVYTESRKGYSEPEVALAIIGDVAFRMPAVRTAEAVGAEGTPVWMYLFTLESTVDGGRYGSPHGMELPFMFHNLGADGVEDFIGENAAFEEAADRVQDHWIAFVRDGDPSIPDAEWPAYDTDERLTMMLDVESRVAADPLADERGVWGDMAFDGLDPDLAHLNPEMFDGTRITLGVVVEVLGPVWTTAIVVVLAATIGATVFGVRRFVRRRRRRRGDNDARGHDSGRDNRFRRRP